MRKLPVAMFLNSTANEHDTTGDIELMGKKLADEIKSYINRFIDNQNEVIINLVGHSMGGIIARAALPYL
jgi:triacylglycerol esterase/lipase EstA (alpha/beta hydrolase family)